MRDWRRYFPSSGRLHARPTTPHPPSASCLPTWTLDIGNDLLESIICCIDNALTWSHLFQDRLEVRRPPVLRLQYLGVRGAEDIGISLGHVRLVNLSENGFEIDSIGDARSVDDIQDIGERVSYLDQIFVVRCFLELSHFLADQSYSEVPGRLIHRTRGGTDEFSEPVVEFFDHPLLRVHLYRTSRSFLPRRSLTLPSPKLASIDLSRFDHALKRLTIRCSPHSGSI